MMDRATIIEREKEREFGERYAFGSRERIGNSAGTLVNKSRAAKTGRGGNRFTRPSLFSFLSKLSPFVSGSSIDLGGKNGWPPLQGETHYGRVVIIRHCRVMIRECARPLSLPSPRYSLAFERAVKGSSDRVPRSIVHYEKQK